MRHIRHICIGYIRHTYTQVQIPDPHTHTHTHLKYIRPVYDISDIYTATGRINGNRSDGVQVVNWYKSAVENR